MEDEQTVDIGPAKGNCGACPYQATLLINNKCTPGDACIQVKSGRQIDRFLRNNPSLANHYLDDEFWETRAIAVRYASQSKLIELITDPDEVVRRAVAYRVPVAELVNMISDPDREVRITVADRIDYQHLEKMADDPDYLVRVYVTRRLPSGRLFRMICDPDPQVRKEVASRIPEASLGLMANDSELEVRRILAERMNPDEVAVMLDDSEWLVRLIAAERVDISYLRDINREDEDPEVRETITRRLSQEN